MDNNFPVQGKYIAAQSVASLAIKVYFCFIELCMQVCDVTCFAGTGHSHYKRKWRYCPSAPEQVPYPEWLARVKAEEAAAARAMSDSSNAAISGSDTDEMN